MTGSTLRALALASAAAFAVGGGHGPASAAPGPTAVAEADEPGFALIVRIAVKPDRVEGVLPLMRARVQESRARPEVIDFRVLATNDPTVFLVFESFRGKAAFDAFAALPESAAFVGRIRDVLARPLEVEQLRGFP